MKRLLVLPRLILGGSALLWVVASACDQVPQDATTASRTSASVLPHNATAPSKGDSSVVVDDTLRPPDFVEPGAHEIIDQMISDYEAYVTQYRELARQSETDDRAFIKADSLLRHAENVYAGLIDAMEINPFSRAQRRRLDSARRRFDRLAKQYHAYPLPKRATH